MTIAEHGDGLNVATTFRLPRPWENSIREGRMEITPEIAEQILREANYQGQRKCDHRTVSVYSEMMRRGLWELSDPIAFARHRGALTLVNGQHRLHAVIAYGRPIQFRIAVNECETEEEMKSLYYRFDTVMRQRTDSQILSAVGLADEHGISKSAAKATYRAVGIIVNNFRTPGAATMGENVARLRVVDLRIDACTPWWEAAKALDVALQKGDTALKTRIMRATTFAVALMTMKYQPDKATQFWRGVAENDGLKRNDPRNVLVADLLRRDASQGVHDQGAFAAAIAWNAYFEQRPLTIIKIAENMKLRIAGTPVGSRRS